MMPRNATIQCVGEVHMAVMSKDNYSKVLMKINTRNQNKVLEFFKSIPALAKNSNSYLKKLEYNFEVRQYIRNQELFREGDPSDTVYLVKTGEFELTKKIKYIPIPPKGQKPSQPSRNTQEKLLASPNKKG